MDSLPFGEMMVFRGFSEDSGFGYGGGGGGGGMMPSSLVLDPERGELVRATAAAVGKMAAEVGPEMKAAMTLKSHCEAERRRRERINSHLTTLRGLVPTNSKLDKAALLAEVITQVKELKNSAAEVSKKCTLPSDNDEVKVEAYGDEMNPGNFLIKASICCEDRLELLTDLKQTIRSLRLKIMSAEISFLGGRVKNVFVLSCEGTNNNTERNLLRNSVLRALESVLNRISTKAEFSPRTLLAGKRQRISPFDSSYSFT